MISQATTPATAIVPEIQVLLDPVSEISALFQQERVRFWLQGGWALVFLLGRKTCPHGDLKQVIGQRHARRVRVGIEGNGDVDRDGDFLAQMNLVKDGAGISVVLLHRLLEGGIPPSRVPKWPWLPGLLETRCHPCPCTS